MNSIKKPWICAGTKNAALSELEVAAEQSKSIFRAINFQMQAIGSETRKKSFVKMKFLNLMTGSSGEGSLASGLCRFNVASVVCAIAEP